MHLEGINRYKHLQNCPTGHPKQNLIFWPILSSASPKNGTPQSHLLRKTIHSLASWLAFVTTHTCDMSHKLSNVLPSPRHQSCSLHRWWFGAFLEYPQVPCLFPRSKQAVEVLERRIFKQVSTRETFDTRFSTNWAMQSQRNHTFKSLQDIFEPLEMIRFSMFFRLSTDQSVSHLWSEAPYTSGHLLQHQSLGFKLRQREKWRATKNLSLWNPCGEHIHGVGYQPRKSKLLANRKCCRVPIKKICKDEISFEFI